MLPMKNASFKESRIIQCRFSNTDLTKSCFVDADLAGTLFHNCDLREADFAGAINYVINPCENRIKKARFTSPACLGLVKSLDIVIIE
jgi:fluoroquinolone resistance protein